MVLCSNCKKRPAVVFITSMHGSEKKNEGFCLVCAKKLNIPQVAEYMEHIGISDEDIEMMSDQMMDLMEDENFEMGGASTLPNFIQRLFTDHPVTGTDSEQKEEPKKNNSSSLFGRDKQQDSAKLSESVDGTVTYFGKYAVVVGKESKDKKTNTCIYEFKATT